MDINFKISSFTEIEYKGQEFDLHNNFSFESYSMNREKSELRIFFKKSDGDWVPKDEPGNLTFILSEIKYLKTVEPSQEYFEDDSILAGITFFWADDRAENYGLLEQETPNPGDDIIFTFESDRVIRANCNSVTLFAY
jgi:hypothetical protein